MIDIMSSPEDVMADALRKQLVALLEECSETQQAFFVNIFKCKAETLPVDRLASAIGLCQRAVLKNRNDPSRLSA